MIKFQLKTIVDVINMRISCRYPFCTLCYKDINFCFQCFYLWHRIFQTYRAIF